MSLMLEYTVTSVESGATVEKILKKQFDISSGLMCFLKYNERLLLNGSVCRTVDLNYAIVLCVTVVYQKEYNQPKY